MDRVFSESLSPQVIQADQTPCALCFIPELWGVSVDTGLPLFLTPVCGKKLVLLTGVRSASPQSVCSHLAAQGP